ncbi:BAT1 [Scenedesmus sp. PABB004]|nr:BAT1 [Scenedesmus sp. PABB004]
MGHPSEAQQEEEVVRVVAEDDERLKMLGYTPVLRRAWSGFSTLCIVLSSMSVLTSIIASFDVALVYGGPAVAVWGWVGVSACVFCVALSMAELSSAYPTSAGMLYWCFRLVEPRWAHFTSWMAGWLNVVAQVSGNSAQCALQADLTITLVSMVAAYQGRPAPTFSPGETYGIFAAWVLAASVANSLGDTINIKLNQLGGMLNVWGAVALMVIIPAVATRHQPAGYVFGHFERAQAAAEGITNPIYIAALGLLLPAWAYTGLDSAQYMAEETFAATHAQPRAILLGAASMFALGLALVVSLLFSMPSLAAVVDEGSVSGGYALAQILYDVFAARTGSPLGGILLFAALPFAGVFLCSMSSMTYTARICFAYGRDRLLPFGGWWGAFNYRTRTPQNAVWGVTALSLSLGLPMLGSSVAFESLLSLSTTALFLLYAGPATLRITVGRRRFRPGAFSLGRWAYACGAAATAWWAFSLVVFSLPTVLPVSAGSFNYAPLTLVGTLGLAAAWYALPCIGGAARYAGPAFDVAAFEDALAHGASGEAAEAAAAAAGAATLCGGGGGGDDKQKGAGAGPARVALVASA